MRTSAFVPVVVLNALLALGCTGGLMSSDPPKPEFDRGEYRIQDVPSKQFEAMDLPYYGGKVYKSTDGFMEVSYPPHIASVEQLVEWWPAAVEAEGWKKTSGGPTANGGYSATYDLDGGRSGTLSIRPTGTLWTVVLTADPPTP